MQVWCFIGAGGLWALSSDEAGTHLPADLGPWQYLKTVMLTGVDAEEREAEGLIRQHSFCCFDGAAEA